MDPKLHLQRRLQSLNDQPESRGEWRQIGSQLLATSTTLDRVTHSCMVSVVFLVFARFLTLSPNRIEHLEDGHGSRRILVERLPDDASFKYS